MKKSNKILLIILLILLIIIIVNMWTINTKGKYQISADTTTTACSGETINFNASVVKKTTLDTVNGKIKAVLYDSNNKKVKNTAKSFNYKQNTDNLKENYTLDLPDDMEEGTYTLKLTGSKGIYSDEVKTQIQIVKNGNVNATISLDKGIYKPGDEINYRTLVTYSKDNTPASGEVNVSIYDGNSNKVYSENTSLSEFGIISGCFELGDTVNSGEYKIVVTCGNKTVSKSFNVNPYTTPEYEVTLTPENTNYLVGDTAKVTLEAKYFFGEPVKNAEVTCIINNDENNKFEGITDNDGKYTLTFNVDKANTYNIEAEVKDSSNYMIDESTVVYGSEDKIILETYTEFGGSNIYKNMSNDIYFVTKNPSGTGVKSYLNISFKKINKQVITSEEGIGKLQLSTTEIAELAKSGSMSVQVQNTLDGTQIEKDIPFSVLDTSSYEVLLKTDSFKYKENQDITLSILNNVDAEIYVVKGNQVLKTISAVSNDEIVFNLEDVSGVIDIYAYTKNNTFSYKKTIYIEPENSLSVSLSTDKNEYSPSDKLALTMEAKDQNGESIDTAFLVSIIDKAQLSLADNDLTIDNITLALKDITLSNGITAEDLYASAIDKDDSTLLEELLISQDHSNINVQSITHSSDSTAINDLLLEIGISLSIIVVIILLFKNASKYKVCVTILNCIALTLLFIVTFGENLSEFYYDIFDTDIFVTIWTIVTFLAISIILYFAVFYRQAEYIFKVSKELFIYPAMIILIASIPISILSNLAYQYSDAIEYHLARVIKLCIVLFVLVLLGFGLVLARKSNVKKLNVSSKASKVLRKIFKIAKYIIKVVIFWYAFAIIYENLDYNNENLAIYIVLAIYIAIDKLVFGKTKIKLKEGKIDFKITQKEFWVGVTAVSGILLVLFGFAYIYTSSQSTITDSMSSMSSMSSTSSSDGHSVSAGSYLSSSVSDSTSTSGSSSGSGKISFKSIDADTFAEAADTTGTASSTSSSFFGLFGSFASNVSSEVSSEENSTTINDVKTVNETETNKVRNVFLDSLAFIPEVDAKEGKTTQEIDLSDNITTWKVQVVGNTKEGSVGYGSTEFKVFKEFFINYSMPNNAVIGDKISIPVTAYNYTSNALHIKLNVISNEYFNLTENSSYEIDVDANSTQMVYVPLELIKVGDTKLRIESTASNVSDIVEKTFKINEKGVEKNEVVSSGSISDDTSLDVIYNDAAIENSKKLKVKIYPSQISQIVENMDAILLMPSGCFEQVSSSLYPDILALKYLRNNNLSNEEIENKALDYINTGYQKLLTYQVKGSKGGYSLYGRAPAETVITAFGLMEFNDLKEVYEIDENVINDSVEFIFSKRKTTGSFEYKSTYIGEASNTSDIAMNAYITYALSEVVPNDSRIDKSVEYLEKQLERNSIDYYTYSLMANIYANIGEKQKAKDILKKYTDELYYSDEILNKTYDDKCDYWGTYGKYKNIQVNALTSLALSKLDYDKDLNLKLIESIISAKDSKGSWHNTQSTILALKAIDNYSSKSKIEEQTVTIKLNGEEKKVEIKKDSLDYYEVEFDNPSDENKLSIDFKKGELSYEVVKSYYQEYSKVKSDGISLGNNFSLATTNNLSNIHVNDTLYQSISVNNTSKNTIENMIIRINIPQGCSVDEDSLKTLLTNSKIDKYEYNYQTIDIYVRNFVADRTLTLDVSYTVKYPEEITGGSVYAYDYYNPNISGYSLPVTMRVID